MTPVHRDHEEGSTPADVHRFTVVIADGDAAFGDELAEVLDRDPRIELVQTVSSAREAVASAQTLRPDIVLVGELPDADLDEVTASIARIGTIVVIVLVRPGRAESLPPHLHVAGFLRGEGTAEEVLRGFFEVASLAVHMANDTLEDPG